MKKIAVQIAGLMLASISNTHVGICTLFYFLGRGLMSFSQNAMFPLVNTAPTAPNAEIANNFNS